MKNEIDQYVESLYKELEDTKEVRDLKEEIRNHLEESASHLQSQGYSEDESIRLAIQLFGNNEEFLGTLNRMYNTNLNRVAVTRNKTFNVPFSFGVASLLFPIIGIFLSIIGFFLIYRQGRIDREVESVKRVRSWALTLCTIGLIVQLLEIMGLSSFYTSGTHL